MYINNVTKVNVYHIFKTVLRVCWRCYQEWLKWLIVYLCSVSQWKVLYLLTACISNINDYIQFSGNDAFLE